jgi:hypothetical protein
VGSTTNPSGEQREPITNFTYVEEVFIKAHGKPTRVDTPTLTNKFGMRVTGRNLTWEGKRTSIALQRYGVDLKESVIRGGKLRPPAPSR